MHNQMDEIAVSGRLDDVIEMSMRRLKKEQKMKRLYRSAGACAGAVLALGFVFCASNTALASKLPLIGNIFSHLSGKTMNIGDFSEDAEILLQEDALDRLEQGDDVESSYVQTSNGITFAITEMTYDKKNLYLGVSVQSSEPFDKGLMYTSEMEDYILDYDVLNLMATERIEPDERRTAGASDESTGKRGIYEMQGNFTDANTFVGILSISMQRNASDMQEGAFDAQRKELGPDNFHYDFCIEKIFGYDCFFDMQNQNAENEEMAKEIAYTGSWNFSLDVAVRDGMLEVIELDKVNEDGVGIKTVEKSKYAISAELILPDGAQAIDYFTVICDADGDLLPMQGHSAQEYSPYGRDTSSVSIFVCDYIEYMDELKGYYYSRDYETKKQTKTFAEYLSEHALFETKLSFTE